MLLSGGLDSSAVAALMARASDTPDRDVHRWLRPPRRPQRAGRGPRRRRAPGHRPPRAGALARRRSNCCRCSSATSTSRSPTPRCCPPTSSASFAREHVPVVLTGEGGDELLAGYPRYQWFDARRSPPAPPAALAARARAAAAQPRRPALRPLPHARSTTSSPSADDLERHLHWVAGLDPELRPDLVAPALAAAFRPGAVHAVLEPYLGRSAAAPTELVHRLMALDMHTWLVDDVLTKMDKMSMAASVEARVPFLDHRLVEFVAGVPLAIKTGEGPEDPAHAGPWRRCCPPRTIRRRKHAFQIPLDQWLAGPLAGFVREILLDDRARRRGWFDTEPHGDAGRPATATHPMRQSVWTLLCLELWAREFLDSKPEMRGVWCVVRSGAVRANGDVVRPGGESTTHHSPRLTSFQLAWRPNESPAPHLGLPSHPRRHPDLDARAGAPAPRCQGARARPGAARRRAFDRGSGSHISPPRRRPAGPRALVHGAGVAHHRGLYLRGARPDRVRPRRHRTRGAPGAPPARRALRRLHLWLRDPPQALETTARLPAAAVPGCVVACSDFTRGAVLDLGVHPTRVRVLYPGVDAERFTPSTNGAHRGATLAVRRSPRRAVQGTRHRDSRPAAWCAPKCPDARLRDRRRRAAPRIPAPHRQERRRRRRGGVPG